MATSWHKWAKITEIEVKLNKVLNEQDGLEVIINSAL